ncbi:hypothetical protein Fmac_008947 [Flemingia macrophylla]|uniref:Uncharacterized protein n=1 Tax=Flemingia macrophylla TaxID=520843 RepID=A0ABD1MYU1_9FABA
MDDQPKDGFKHVEEPKLLIPKMMETTPKDDVGEETVKTTSLGAAHQLLGQQGCSGDDEKEAHSTKG